MYIFSFMTNCLYPACWDKQLLVKASYLHTHTHTSGLSPGFLLVVILLIICNSHDNYGNEPRSMCPTPNMELRASQLMHHYFRFHSSSSTSARGQNGFFIKMHLMNWCEWDCNYPPQTCPSIIDKRLQMEPSESKSMAFRRFLMVT